jgi:hypothetical protein
MNTYKNKSVAYLKNGNATTQSQKLYTPSLLIKLLIGHQAHSPPGIYA